MLQTGANLIQLKQTMSLVPQAHRGIAATIGLLATSGLNHTRKIPKMRHIKLIYQATGTSSGHGLLIKLAN